MSGMLSLGGVTAADVVYTVLPLHHVMGLVLGVLGCLELGERVAGGRSCARAPDGAPGWQGLGLSSSLGSYL